VDIAFKREPAGLVMMRRLPKINYTSVFKYRWVTRGGENAYTNLENCDPNHDPDEHRTGWEKPPVRERKVN
jgi:hypothetical protein